MQRDGDAVKDQCFRLRQILRDLKGILHDGRVLIAALGLIDHSRICAAVCKLQGKHIAAEQVAAVSSRCCKHRMISPSSNESPPVFL